MSLANIRLSLLRHSSVNRIYFLDNFFVSVTELDNAIKHLPFLKPKFTYKYDFAELEENFLRYYEPKQGDIIFDIGAGHGE